MAPKKRKAAGKPGSKKPAKRPAAQPPAPRSEEEEEEEEGAGGPTWEDLATWCDLEARVRALERDWESRRATGRGQGAKGHDAPGPSLAPPSVKAEEEEEEGARAGQPVRPALAGEGAPRALQERIGGDREDAAPGASAWAGPANPGRPPAPQPSQGMGPPGGLAAPHARLPLGGDAQWPPADQKRWPALPCGAPGPSGGAGTPLASGDQELPLGYHLLPATQEKILRGEYVDIFSLLNRKGEEEEEKPQVERTWANWLPAFLIYASVIIEARPWQALGLIQYLDLIYKAYVGFQGPAWPQYDEAFRWQVSIRPSLPWGAIHPQLWLRYISPALPFKGVRTDSGHLMRGPVPDSDPCQAEGQPGGRFRGLCWRFGTQGTCDWQPCKYEHKCSVCGGRHAFTVCPKGKRAKSWGRMKKGPREEEPPDGPCSG